MMYRVREAVTSSRKQVDFMVWELAVLAGTHRVCSFTLEAPQLYAARLKDSHVSKHSATGHCQKAIRNYLVTAGRIWQESRSSGDHMPYISGMQILFPANHEGTSLKCVLGEVQWLPTGQRYGVRAGGAHYALLLMLQEMVNNPGETVDNSLAQAFAKVLLSESKEAT